MAHHKKDPQPDYTDDQKDLIKVATLLQKKGLKEKEAVANRQRVYYFRADMFHELVLENSKQIMEILAKNIKLEKLDWVEDSMELGDVFMNHGLLRSFDRVKDEPQKYKYPKKLVHAKLPVKEKGFYAFEISKPQTKMTFLAIGLAVSVIAIILFPLWPYTVKLWIFSFLFYFSAGMLGLIVVRLIIYLFLFLFGIDFWIFPNLLDDDVAILESFLPLLAIGRREDGWAMFFFRVLLALCLAAYWYNESGLPLPITQTGEFVNDIFEWGKDKMVGNETNAIQYTGQGHKSLDDILKMTEEYEREEEEERQRKEQEEKERQEEEKRENEDL